MDIYRVTGIVLIAAGVLGALLSLATWILPAIEFVPVPATTSAFLVFIGIMLLVWHRRQRRDSQRGERR